MTMQPSDGRTPPPWLFRVLGKLAAPWLAIRREPPGAGADLVRPDLPICYVIERYGLSNALILEQSCREAGLPSPLVAMPVGDLVGRRRALIALSRRQGYWFGRPRNRTHSEGLARLVARLNDDPSLDVQIVPVSIFVGRAPDRQSGWFRVLFAENWGVVGRFRRFLAIVLNGRHTIVQFSPPVSMREVLQHDLTPERNVRKIARVLRAHFRRIRTAVIGPDLSHRRTLVDGVLASDPVRRAIADLARKENTNYAQAWRRAHRDAMEVAADYSHTVVRSLSFVLTPFWNKIYRGVTTHHFDGLKQNAPGHEVIYVPCHRSHIDYLLLSYLLYVNGIVPPHIAAGVNLNLPVVGSLLRRGGAFFLRRSFKSNALYSAVFSEYVGTLIGQGVSIEYFIEGGRSRTGRLLAPKSGMLAMTLRAYLRQPRRPVLFQPVYIGYEQLMEGKSYLDELSGRPKQKETIWALLRGVAGVLRHNYGKVAVSFGEPILLDDILATHAPDWRERRGELDAKPPWFGDAVDDLAQRIQVNINRAADVNPINLLAVALLSTPKYAMAESDLLAQLELSKALLEAVPYSDRVTVTPLSPAEIVAYGEEVKVLTRTRHPLGDVLSLDGEQAVLQSYFRNNVLHLFACAAWVACCFQNSRRMSQAGILRLGKLVYPFIQRELFLPWNEEQFGEHLQATIAVLAERGLIAFDPESGQLQRGPGQTDEVFQLRAIAHSLLQAFERYYIAIAVLVKNGSGAVSAGELENLCHLTAQRLSLLYSQSAPEFFDRSLFRGFIATLRELEFVRVGENGKLVYSERLEAWAKDSKIILSRELRQAILKITPDMAREVAEPPALPVEGVEPRE
ncbi:glycerol-3-phosphate O-acyltransferase [Chiayiivirga flava]|uniref:Glycerol-3-phosphate acyltransferase n=1 Tax=Chiayiivirga flava TaxID=659595 RepID=A0A7W8DA62_9GAMM|nr:glycerol-3-phosphate 1-O-acyltransferase PlsB [Chiayiivirga flava]MBB5209595.1 glycerol-3-phosphate O-acyltransferase [Chiayiivirga flava]